jgi:hypothetical protein
VSTRLGTGAKAGIGAAAAVLMILLAIIAFLVLKMKRRKRSGEKDLVIEPQPIEQEKQQGIVQVYHSAPVEMFAEDAPLEIGGRYPTELPGSNPHPA